MPKQQLPLIASHNYNSSLSTASREELVNIFIEQYPDNVSGRQGLMVKGTPGLNEWEVIDAAGVEIRGMLAHKNIGYTILDNDLWSTTSAQVSTDRGDLATSTGRCSICALNDEIIMCDGTDSYSYKVTAGTFATIGSGLAAIDTHHVVAHSEFVLFLVKNSNLVYVSDVADGRTIGATSYFTVAPDFSNLVSAATTSGLVYIFSDGAAQIYYPSGQSTVPFDRLAGGFIQIGCAAQHSPLVLNDTVYWLGKNSSGVIGVCRAKGTDYEIISTPAFSSEINTYDSVSDAFAWTDTHDGHIFYNLTFPSVDSATYVNDLGITWSYDTTNNTWFIRKSFDADINLYTRHWASGSMNIGGTQVVGGYLDGRLLEISMDYVDDDGEEIVRKLTTPHMLANGEFYSMYNMEVYVEPSKATASVTSPQLMLEISNDYGNTWSDIQTATVSTTGNYPNPARFPSLGGGDVFTLRFTMSDPIEWAITNVMAYLEIPKVS